MAKTSNTKKVVKSASNGLADLLTQRLQSIYWAESELLKTLPQLKEQSNSQKLQAAITEHIAQTQMHVTRLEEIFSALKEKAGAIKCEGLQGILKEGAVTISQAEEGPVRDAAIIGACQLVEHYEIASYGTLAAYAKVLNEKQVLDLLLKTLTEEKKSDQILSAIADTQLNASATTSRA
ncbi:YciE/YciF ferroxidase family protein [Niabella hibiscisoli]|uniref:YciE/YciF ferroxidase family protein n=1 Tax=Niabella hibiscisoli TaxID=1825928 RepID=UPI001F1057D8|nr:ferritin-like domain-containing protein [Niabella hibiscisoli]MCH5718747.1 ferritin-like domain-containing protein [Niabella hibiscisoli]